MANFIRYGTGAPVETYRHTGNKMIDKNFFQFLQLKIQINKNKTV
jgi:hypothetical protein